MIIIFIKRLIFYNRKYYNIYLVMILNFTYFEYLSINFDIMISANINYNLCIYVLLILYINLKLYTSIYVALTSQDLSVITSIQMSK